MENSWTDRVRNEVLQGIQEEKNILTHLLTYLLTSWSKVLLEKLTGSQLVKNFPAFYGTRRFITALQKPTICPYPEPDSSSPCSLISLPEDPF